MDIPSTITVYRNSYVKSEFGKTYRLNRTYSYLKEASSPITQIKCTVAIAANVIGCGGMGFKAGAAVGGPQGALVGGLGGGLFGAGAAVYVIVIKSEKNNHYIDWASTKIHSNIHAAYLDLLDKDEMLSTGCMCYLSNDFVENAILAPDGKLYDEFHLLNYFRSPHIKTDSMHRFASPINPDHYFTILSCQRLPQIDLFVLKRKEYLLNVHLELLKNDSSQEAREISQALMNIKMRLPEKIQQKYNQCILQITEMNDNNILNDEQMMLAKQNFNKFFGRSAQADIFATKSKEELEEFQDYILSGPRPQSYNPSIKALETNDPHISYYPASAYLYKYYPE